VLAEPGEPAGEPMELFVRVAVVFDHFDLGRIHFGFVIGVGWCLRYSVVVGIALFVVERVVVVEWCWDIAHWSVGAEMIVFVVGAQGMRSGFAVA